MSKISRRDLFKATLAAGLGVTLPAGARAAQGGGQHANESDDLVRNFDEFCTQPFRRFCKTISRRVQHSGTPAGGVDGEGPLERIDRSAVYVDV